MEFEANRVNIDIRGYEGKPVKRKDWSILISESCVINLEKNKSLVYLDFNSPVFDCLIPYLQELRLNKSNRQQLGTNNYSILAGGIPARTNHASFCSFGSLADKDSRLNYEILNNLSVKLNKILKSVLPQWHKIGAHFFKQAMIHSDYQMADTFWTSAIINKNSEHNYHFDKSNLKNTYSAMLTFKNSVAGGFLVLPEYDLALKTSNRSLTFFYGKNILHGVSPISYLGEEAYRYSIVLYTVEQLRKCLSLHEEFNKVM